MNQAGSGRCLHAVRNTASFVPMYGCTVDRDEVPMLLRWIMHPDGTVHSDPIAYLSAGENDLHRFLYIGGERRWPAGPLLPPRVQRLIPLICSINPMGTPCRRFAHRGH